MAEHNDIKIRIAQLNIKMLCRYPHASRLCADFITEDEDTDISVSVTEDEISAEAAQYGDRTFSNGYCESICLYRAIAEKLPSYDGFVFHGAAVNICGKGYIFAARSGTGKTTHISLLLDNYPDDVTIINGDKPIIRRIGQAWFVCSTPWAGKEGWKRNTSAPLAGIVLLERSEHNFIEKTEPRDHFDAVMGQVYLPRCGEGQLKTFELIDKMSEETDFYRLGCNMEPDAARTSFSMFSAKKNETD